MGYEVLCKQSEIALGTMKAFEIAGEKIILFHLSDGFYATQSKCTHLFAPLEKGTIVDDCKIQCKLHHAEFDIKTGKAEKWANFPPGIQALNFIRGEKDLRTYTIKVVDENILIDLNNAVTTSEITSTSKSTDNEPV